MARPAEDATRVAYVFGYGSLVELTQPLAVDGRLYPAVPGRLNGFRRRWGVASNNRVTTDAQKHFLDPESGLKPKVAVAYLDIEEAAGEAVNGLAIPVDPNRLAELDLREGNYRRAEVSAAFEPALTHTVFVYHGTEPARVRAAENGEHVYVSRQYVERVRRAFTALGPGQLEEYERTTGPLPFPARDLEPRYPGTAS